MGCLVTMLEVAADRREAISVGDLYQPLDSGIQTEVRRAIV